MPQGPSLAIPCRSLPDPCLSFTIPFLILSLRLVCRVESSWLEYPSSAAQLMPICVPSITLSRARSLQLQSEGCSAACCPWSLQSSRQHNDWSHGHGLDIETRHVTQFVPGDRNPQLKCGVTVRCGVSGEMKTSAHLVPGWWSGDGDVCCLLPDLDRFH